MAEETLFRCARLFADSHGESHFGEYRLPLEMKDFAPPAAPLATSAPQEATAFVVIQLPVTWGGEKPHPSPGRQLLFCLTGSFEVTASDGVRRAFKDGEALLLEDTFGKGHVTKVTSQTPVSCVMIAMP